MKGSDGSGIAEVDRAVAIKMHDVERRTAGSSDTQCMPKLGEVRWTQHVNIDRQPPTLVKGRKHARDDLVRYVSDAVGPRDHQQELEARPGENAIGQQLAGRAAHVER